MARYLLILVLLAASVSCGRRSAGTAGKEQAVAESHDSGWRAYDAAESKKPEAVGQGQNDGREPTELQDMTHDYSDFPSNFVVTEYGPSFDHYTYYLYADNIVLIVAAELLPNIRSGIWKLDNDTIRMDIYREVGTQGYGKLLEGSGAETPYVGHEYYYNYDVQVRDHIDIAVADIGEWGYRVDSALFAIDYDRHEMYWPKPSGNYTFASYRKVTGEELNTYSAEQLSIMRNEIFARYGYRFSSPRLKEYFGAKEWYSPREDNVDNYLTEIEKYNIALIREAESLSKN